MTKSLESDIDDLYRRPLDQFTKARAELASGLKGEDARLVKSLKKPTLVPWAVNQVYWHARIDFDRLLKSGDALRKAQLAALGGRPADLTRAAAAHRDAVSAVVAKATSLAGAVNLHPGRDQLARTFESLSLASTPPEPFGRLTQPLQPGGFEMLSGIEPSAGGLKLVSRTGSVRPEPPPPPAARSEARPDQDAAARKRAEERQRREAEIAAHARERELAAAARRRDEAIEKAEAALARARETQADAERAWRRAQEEVVEATRTLRKIQADS